MQSVVFPLYGPGVTQPVRRNFIPATLNSYGRKLIFNDSARVWSLTGSAKGTVGKTSLASRAYNRRR